MIKIVGKTTDGKTVVRGAWQFRCTFGMPIDVLLEKLKNGGLVPDQEYLFSEAPRSKWGEIRLALKDVYGNDCITL